MFLSRVSVFLYSLGPNPTTPPPPHSTLLTSGHESAVNQISSLGVPQLDVIDQRIHVVLIHHVRIRSAEIKVIISVISSINRPSRAFVDLHPVHVESQSVRWMPRDFDLVPCVRIQIARRRGPLLPRGTNIGRQFTVTVINIDRGARHEIRVLAQLVRLYFKRQREARRTARLGVPVAEHATTKVNVLPATVQVDSVAVDARPSGGAAVYVDVPRVVIELVAVDTVHVKPHARDTCGETLCACVEACKVCKACYQSIPVSLRQ